MLGAIIQLASVGIQAGLQHGATAKAEYRANQLSDRKADINEEDRAFALQSAKSDLSRAKDEFTHQKAMGDASRAFTKQDADRGVADVLENRRDTFTSNVLSMGKGAKQDKRQRSMFRMENM